jgi:putative glutathione S-transferase
LALPRLGRIDWAFTVDPDNVDPVLGIHYISEVYKNADASYNLRPTVPCVVDLTTKCVVNDDYRRLTYYLERECRPFHRPGAPDLFPADLQGEIESLNQIIFGDISNGVYKCGFAKSQAAYEDAFDRLFARFDEFEVRLATPRYLHGDRLTDSDIRLYVTLARFDVAVLCVACYSAFLVNKKRLIDYPKLWAYARNLYQTPGFGSTSDFIAIKKHYYHSMPIEPNEAVVKILPKGPDVEGGNLPHGREALARAQ